MPKAGRIYVRRFDHEEAQTRHAAGETINALAAEYGVTPQAVRRVTTPGAKAREVAYSRAWRTGVCEICEGPAMRLVCGKRAHNPDGRTLCNTCRGQLRREAVRVSPSGGVEAVRCLAVDCANGDRWQPPSNFPRGRRYRDLREGGFHSHCRACQTRAKADYRARNSERAREYDRTYSRKRRAAVRTR